jgi:ceramide glucosyltransferase
VLVISDSDMHVRPDYLQAVISELICEATGLVTTIYTGRPASSSFAALLGAAQIDQRFLPGALLGRLLGRQDCLGATMALRRETLAAIGGFAALADHLADDNKLGRLVRLLGLRVELAATMTATTVPETSLSDLIRHELRWARTMRFAAPAGLACSVLQYPMAWATLTVALSRASVPAIVLACLAWLGCGVVARMLRSTLGLKPEAALSWWLLPLRDALSLCVIVASFCGARVLWRGNSLSARDPDLSQSRAIPVNA